MICDRRVVYIISVIKVVSLPAILSICQRYYLRSSYGGSMPKPPSRELLHLTVETLPVVCQPQSESVSTSKPLWFIQKYSRPMRRVVSRQQQTWRNPRGHLALVLLYDVLECGHRLLSASGMEGDPLNKHRRCHECAPKASTASSDGARHSRAA